MTNTEISTYLSWHAAVSQSAPNTHKHGHCARTAFTRALRCLAKPSTASQRTAPPPGMPRCTCAQRHAAAPSPFSRRQPPRARPTPSRLGNEDSPMVACTQGPRKLSRGSQTPLGKLRHIRVSPPPLSCHFPAGAIHPVRHAKERAQTRGGRQPWEEHQ